MTHPCTDPMTLAEYDTEMAERDAVLQGVADGDLCGRDGKECDFQEYRELYGADRDGNRGEWVTYVYCSKCGEPPPR